MMLSKYEILLDKVYNYGIDVFELDLVGDCGYCYNDVIFINKNSSEVTKYCILSEELGHYLKTVGDITNLEQTSNMKQEIVARRWSIDNLLTPDKIISVLLSGVSNKYELLDELYITDSFLDEAIQYYKNKFGIYYVGETHLLVFEPLHIVEIY